MGRAYKEWALCSGPKRWKGFGNVMKRLMATLERRLIRINPVAGNREEPGRGVIWKDGLDALLNVWVPYRS